MRTIPRLLAAVAVVFTTPLFAQVQPNTVITGVEGLPWGASRAQVEAKFGAPDSVHVRGDTVNLIYQGKPVAGTTAQIMDVLIAPADEMASVAYLIKQTPGDCATTFDQVVSGITGSMPGLRVGPLEVIAGGSTTNDVARACRSFSQNPTYGVVVSRTLRDPTGPGSVSLFNMGSSQRGTTLVIQFRRASRGRR
ncbi:MAG TPA: hypothetical protein VFS20_22480 [Longimicrobium sp.]|nr:hypothetical protein [Longimicrobium sp.]